MITPTPSHISEIDAKILLALLIAPTTSYQIRKIMEIDSDNRIKVSNGTVLPAMKRLQGSKAITKLTDGTYNITNKGKELLREEITTYLKLVYLSHQRGL